MPVVFSHDAFFQRFGGVSRCVVELINHLGSDQPWRVVAGSYGSHFLRQLDPRGGVIEGEWRADAPGRIGAALRNEPGFARTLAALPGAIVHRSYYPVIDRLPAHVPVVVTLHDMYWEAPETPRSLRHSMHSWFKRRALNRANRIICISRFTLDELTRYWPHLAEKAEVIPHGVTALAPLSDVPPAKTTQFLFVGERLPRKNFGMAIAGLAASGLEEYSLLCVGGGALTDTEEALIAQHGLTGRVTQRTADDRTLAAAYAGAAALLYPSTYEGFGMPLLEAMLHGCPVIAARASCLPEIGGEAAVYADPHDPEAWGSAMRGVIEPAQRDALIQRGRAHASEFTWEDVARRYTTVYRQLAARAG